MFYVPELAFRQLHIWQRTLKAKERARLEITIATDREYSVRYATEIIQRRFYIGEEAIIQEPNNALHYTLNVVKGRFELGEKVMSENSYTAYKYAKDIIKGRWVQGEPAIQGNRYYNMKYKYFLKEQGLL